VAGSVDYIIVIIILASREV